MPILKNLFLGWILCVSAISFANAEPATEPTPATPSTPTVTVEKVDINTANAADLAEKLEGIGEKKAADIVEFREKNGPFKVPADIMQVLGIGEKIFEKNKDKIVTSLPTDNVEEGTTTEKTESVAPKPVETTAPATSSETVAPSSKETTETTSQTETTPQNEGKTEESNKEKGNK